MSEISLYKQQDVGEPSLPLLEHQPCTHYAWCHSVEGDTHFGQCVEEKLQITYFCKELWMN